MLVQLDRKQARAILGSIRQVATRVDKTPLTDLACRTITAAARVVFDDIECAAPHYGTCSPRNLATVLFREPQALWAVRFLAVMALADGILDRDTLSGDSPLTTIQKPAQHGS